MTAEHAPPIPISTGRHVRALRQSLEHLFPDELTALAEASRLVARDQPVDEAGVLALVQIETLHRIHVLGTCLEHAGANFNPAAYRRINDVPTNDGA